MLKFFELEGRFSQFGEEFPRAAVDHVADLVKLPADELAKYDLSSQSAKGHRTQIREARSGQAADGVARTRGS
ncbi:hypothetical protein [Streptomyces sp. NBC_00842]|uniref:hypothetical protein n=1 Tax=unclassified Streptomyces TaxID=2593676 RepID=UPI00386329CE